MLEMMNAIALGENKLLIYMKATIPSYISSLCHEDSNRYTWSMPWASSNSV